MSVNTLLKVVIFTFLVGSIYTYTFSCPQPGTITPCTTPSSTSCDNQNGLGPTSTTSQVYCSSSQGNTFTTINNLLRGVTYVFETVKYETSASCPSTDTVIIIKDFIGTVLAQGDDCSLTTGTSTTTCKGAYVEYTPSASNIPVKVFVYFRRVVSGVNTVCNSGSSLSTTLYGSIKPSSCVPSLTCQAVTSNVAVSNSASFFISASNLCGGATSELKLTIGSSTGVSSYTPSCNDVTTTTFLPLPVVVKYGSFQCTTTLTVTKTTPSAMCVKAVQDIYPAVTLCTYASPCGFSGYLPTLYVGDICSVGSSGITINTINNPGYATMGQSQVYTLDVKNGKGGVSPTINCKVTMRGIQMKGVYLGNTLLLNNGNTYLKIGVTYRAEFDVSISGSCATTACSWTLKIGADYNHPDVEDLASGSCGADFCSVSQEFQIKKSHKESTSGNYVFYVQYYTRTPPVTQSSGTANGETYNTRDGTINSFTDVSPAYPFFPSTNPLAIYLVSVGNPKFRLN